MPEQPGRPSLSIVLHSGEPDRLHYALVLLSAAAAIGRPTIAFFAGPSIRLLTMTGLPGVAQLDQAYAERRIAGIATLLDACRDLKVRFIACETALKAHDLAPADLRTDCAIEIAGAVTLLNDSGSGQLLFV